MGDPAGVPDVDPEKVEVTCDGNTIRISGEIKPPEDNESQNYLMRENFYGAFSREVTLPEETVCEQSRAEFRNGMLVLTLPKAEPTKHQAKKIPVTAGAGNGSKSTVGELPGTQQREPQGASRKQAARPLIPGDCAAAVSRLTAWSPPWANVDQPSCAMLGLEARP